MPPRSVHLDATKITGDQVELVDGVCQADGILVPVSWFPLYFPRLLFFAVTGDSPTPLALSVIIGVCHQLPPPPPPPLVAHLPQQLGIRFEGLPSSRWIPCPPTWWWPCYFTECRIINPAALIWLMPWYFPSFRFSFFYIFKLCISCLLENNAVAVLVRKIKLLKINFEWKSSKNEGILQNQ